MSEPMTQALWQINHGIVHTDAELDEIRDWIDHVSSLDPLEDEEWEAELEQWEVSRG